MLTDQYSTLANVLGRTCDQRLVESLIAEMQIQPGMRVLDLGCGSGGEADLLHKLSGARVYGVDLCREMLELADAATPVVDADINFNPFPAQTFDCTYIINILQLLSDRTAFFREVKRLLCLNGTFGVPVATPEQIQGRFVNSFFPNLVNVEQDRYPAIDTLHAELQSAGFTIASTRTIQLGTSEFNEAYVDRLKAGMLSGIFLLSKEEQEAGFRNLAEEVSNRNNHKNPIRRDRYRTLIIARNQ